MNVETVVGLLEWAWSRLKPKKRILVIEDDPIQAELFSTILSSCGLDCTIAENAEQALALLKRNHLDLIFLDMRLPNMPGSEFLPIIRQLSPDTNVVICCTFLEDLVKEPRIDQFFSVMLKPHSQAKIMEMKKELRF